MALCTESGHLKTLIPCLGNDKYKSTPHPHSTVFTKTGRGISISNQPPPLPAPPPSPLFLSSIRDWGWGGADKGIFYPNPTAPPQRFTPTAHQLPFLTGGRAPKISTSHNPPCIKKISGNLFDTSFGFGFGFWWSTYSGRSGFDIFVFRMSARSPTGRGFMVRIHLRTLTLI